MIATLAGVASCAPLQSYRSQSAHRMQTYPSSWLSSEVPAALIWCVPACLHVLLQRTDAVEHLRTVCLCILCIARRSRVHNANADAIATPAASAACSAPGSWSSCQNTV
jgi:hypothetical protein